MTGVSFFPSGGGSDSSSPPRVVNDSPEFSFSFSSSKKRKKKIEVTSNYFVSKSTGVLELAALNEPAKAITPALRMSVDGVACSDVINSTLSFSGDGIESLSIKVPSAKKNLTLTFSLVAGSEVGSANVTLLNGKRKQRNKALSARDVAKICQKFKKLK